MPLDDDAKQKSTGIEVQCHTVKDHGIYIVKNVNNKKIPGLIEMNFICQCRDLFLSDGSFIKGNRIKANIRKEEVKAFARIYLDENVCILSNSISLANVVGHHLKPGMKGAICIERVVNSFRIMTLNSVCVSRQTRKSREC